MTDIRDRLARELYDPRAAHTPGCGGQLNFADMLRHTCPHCGGYAASGVEPEVTPERGQEMLAELLARRAALGLDAHAST